MSAIHESEYQQEPTLEVQSDRPVSAQEFAERAEDIFQGINYLRDQGSSERDAYKELSESYVADETVADLALFSDIILSLPTMLSMEKAMQRDESAKEWLIAYNHRLRDLIAENPHGFSRPQLTGWLEKACGGSTNDVERIMSGIASEVAVARELQRVPGVHSVRMANVEEDKSGIDIAVTLNNGQTKYMDVKHGEDAYMSGLDRRRSDHAIFAVDAEYMDGFNIKRESRQWVDKNLSRALDIP